MDSQHATLGSPPPRTRAPHAPRVLLAEDDEEDRAMLAALLRHLGYEVVEAANGSELMQHAMRAALWHASGVGTALVVSDIRMPGCSGLQVLAEIRQAGWHVPVLLVTAFGDLDVHARALALGASALLDKPFDVDDFRALVCALAPLPGESEASRR